MEGWRADRQKSVAGRARSIVADEILAAADLPPTVGVDATQHVVLLRSRILDETQMRFGPDNAILAERIRGHIAAGVLLDLIPHLEQFVVFVVDGGTQLDAPTLAGRLLPWRIGFDQRILRMFAEFRLHESHIPPRR